ncbi:MAG TPA: hypothetical protein VHE78_14035 [Gemmatimonadaceae bacterium]|nr:hypothetical protein [Gemmatimonadaceae bacterium]
MKSLPVAGLLALIVVPAIVTAQHAGAGAPPAVTAPHEATQFDFLVGEWELVVQPAATGLAAKLHGVPRLTGTWKAARALDGWGIEDDLRISDASGNPRAFSHAVRVYDAAARHWNSSSLDVYRASFVSATAEWKDGQMVVTSRGTDGDGRAYVSRSRYYEVSPTSFRFQQDRSLDDGRTWSDAVLKIAAKRVR